MIRKLMCIDIWYLNEMCKIDEKFEWRLQYQMKSKDFPSLSFNLKQISVINT